MGSSKFTDALGILAIPVTCILFASQVKLMMKAWKAKNADQLSPFPTLALMGNCIFWTSYSALHVGRADMTIVNAIGVLFQTGYSIVFLRCLQPDKRCKFASMLIPIVVLGILLPALLYGFKVPGRGPILGAIAVAFNICLFASPLDSIRSAVKTLDTSNVPLLLVIVSLTCSIIWFTFALSLETPDAFVAAPNAVGMVLAIVQLSILQYIRIRRKEKGLDQLPMPHSITPDPTVAVNVPEEAPTIAFSKDVPEDDVDEVSLAAKAEKMDIDTTVIAVNEEEPAAMTDDI